MVGINSQYGEALVSLIYFICSIVFYNRRVKVFPATGMLAVVELSRFHQFYKPLSLEALCHQLRFIIIKYC